MRRAIDVRLPSGRDVELELAKDDGEKKQSGLVGARRALESGAVTIAEKKKLVAPGSLALGDFHAIRAIATKLGWLDEDEIEIDCRNCGEIMSVRPCSALPLGPFEEHALDDEELDRRFAFDAPHAVPRVKMPRGNAATTILLANVTLAEATPLHDAIAKDRLRIGASIVRALGIRALGDETAAPVIAKALDEGPDELWSVVSSIFTDAHYSRRLFGIFKCTKCGARNDVDAPYDRELAADFGPSEQGDATASNEESFVTLEEFSAHAKAVARRTIPDRLANAIVVEVDADVPACDDGGEPLLGSYLPPSDGGDGEPARRGEITLFFQTFAAIWKEEGFFDWRDEVRETIEHELEHHLAFERGYDPKDEEERSEIDREAQRIHGKKALLQAEVSSLGSSFGEFVRRTWLLWILIAIGTLVAIVAGKNAD